MLIVSIWPGANLVLAHRTHVSSCFAVRHHKCDQLYEFDAESGTASKSCKGLHARQGALSVLWLQACCHS